jgi:hypothetical protein
MVTLRNLSGESSAAIASAGGIPPIVALLLSPSARLPREAAGALVNLSADVENRVPIASSGGIPPLVALLALLSVDTQEAAASVLFNQRPQCREQGPDS